MLFDPEDALQRLGNDRALLAMLVGVFLNEKGNYEARLKEAARGGDPLEIADAAHQLKGACMTVGLGQIATRAQALELASRNVQADTHTALQAAVERLLDELRQIDAPLKDWLRTVQQTRGDA